MSLHCGTSKSPIPVLHPAHNQVAGHGFKEGQAGSLIDESGQFYKPLPDGGRGNTEIEFYEHLQKDEGIPPNIRPFFPKYYGTIFIKKPNGGQIRHGIMEDVAHGFHNPSIIDLKIGFRTWYPEASEHDTAKYKLKDTRTTSGALGFRVSGMQVYEASSGTILKLGKEWARELRVEEVRLALKQFVSSNPRDETNPDVAFASSIYGGPRGVIVQLEVLKDWFSTQTSYHFASSSVLVIFDADHKPSTASKNEKTCQPVESKPVSVKLVDFAHTFPGKSSVDENFLAGLNALISLLSAYFFRLQIEGPLGFSWKQEYPRDSQGLS